jgi:hypothetical protein
MVRRGAQFLASAVDCGFAAAFHWLGASVPVPAIKPTRGGHRGVSPIVDLRACGQTVFGEFAQQVQRILPSEGS